MYPSAHFASGLIAAAILIMYNIIPVTIVPIILLGVIIPDFDFILSRWAPNNNHRKLITHTPILWFVILILDYLILHTVFIFWISLAAIIHLSLDIFDWGVMIKFPFSRKLCRHLLDETKIDFSSNRFTIIQCDFLRVYFRNKHIRNIELFLGVLSLVTVLLFFKILGLYFLIYIIFIASEIGMLKKVCRKILTNFNSH